MARFKTILTNAGASLLTQALAKSETVTINSVVMGEGVFEEKDKSNITALVAPVEVNTLLGEREFIEGDPSLLKISIQTLNNGLTEPVPIREIGLYAEDTFFAYAWLEGADTDNILPPPLHLEVADTIHLHELALFVTHQENAKIEVTFAFAGFVSQNNFNQHQEDRVVHLSEPERKLLDEIRAEGGIGTDKIVNQAITTAKLADGAVTPDKLATTVNGIREAWFTTPGNHTWTVPAGVTEISVTACGGGGGGAGRTGAHTGTAPQGASGGGGAAAIIKRPFSVVAGQSIAITVGQGGSGGSTSNTTENNGAAGAATVIGNLITLNGGGGATHNTQGASGGTGGGSGGRSSTLGVAGNLNGTWGGNGGIGGAGGAPGNCTAFAPNIRYAVGSGGGGSLGGGGGGGASGMSSGGGAGGGGIFGSGGIGGSSGNGTGATNIGGGGSGGSGNSTVNRGSNGGGSGGSGAYGAGGGGAGTAWDGNNGYWGGSGGNGGNGLVIIKW